jgi:hypothetical protein
MDGVYAELRVKGFSFEEMAEGNLEQMINWKLGPLLLSPLFFELRWPLDPAGARD